VITVRVDEVRSLNIFDGLTDDQLAELVDLGAEIAIVPGVDLFREGEPAEFWWLLVAGAIDLLRRVGREETVVASMNVPGRWAGGFRAWDEHGTYLATGRGVTSGRVLRVPSVALRDLSNAWFPFSGHLIEGLYRTARSIESTARQRESLVALGTLAAGLAHEINNPASAATRSVDALESASQSLLSSIGLLARVDVAAQQFAALDALRVEVEHGVGDPDPLLRADHEEALSAWLGDHGIAREWSIAPPLAAAGVDLDWLSRVEDVLGGPALEAGLQWVASTLTLTVQLSDLKQSTRRISELVAAVKSYSVMDRASKQTINLADGLDATLQILGHKLDPRIRVVREYGADVPPIEAYAAELNQVWTNLIDNAIDAMEGGGTLRLTTRADGNRVIVEIIDSGRGMPPDVARRAFEAFFTTKDVGKGTGLGLDIARRIVEERHGGSISIDTRPGDTRLRVRLPLRPPQ
jgi:signal transduction histidine kinase